MRRYATLLGLAIAVLSAPTAGGESALRRVEVAEPNVRSEVTCDIGDLIAAGRVSPRDAVSTAGGRRDGWLLRTPQSPPVLRWPRNLLNAVPDAPALAIDLQLTGTYDVYALVRAVDAGGALTARAAPRRSAADGLRAGVGRRQPARDRRREGFPRSAFRHARFWPAAAGA